MLTYDTIKKLCKERGATITGVEKELGFARGSLCKVNTNKPSVQKVQKLANYFGVSVDYLMNPDEVNFESGLDRPNSEGSSKSFNVIKKLCEKEGISVSALEKELGYGNASLSKAKKIPAERIREIAIRFNVSMEYLMTGKERMIDLSLKDEKDIAKSLSDTLGKLDSQDGLMFDGEAIDDETRELLKISLENAMRTAKIAAKKKFTPKKYRVDK